MRGERQSDSSGYEEVRGRLLERGYLEGRIERFMLRDLLTGRSGLQRLIRTAFRAAAIGGPLLGALLAVTAATANRPMLGAGDVVLLWVYFTPISALALFLLDLAAAFVVVALARRRGARPGDALRAALLVGLPTLGYLLLLWWNRPATGSPVEDLWFLPMAVLTTMLVAWLAGMVSLAGVIGRTGQVPDRKRRVLMVLVLVLLPLAGASFLLRVGRADGQIAVAPSAFSVPPDAGRLLLVGIDGLDAELVEAFQPRGALLELLATMEGATVFPRSRAASVEPAEVWTTLMTGTTADQHGVRSAGAELLPGIATPLVREAGPLPLKGALAFLLPTRTVPVTGAVRRVRTLWEIVALKRSIVAVGWWASWPAGFDPGVETGGGYVISDRLLPKLLSGASADRDTAPPALFDRLEGDFEGDRARLRQEFTERFPGEWDETEMRWLWESFLIDGYAWTAGGRLARDSSVAAVFLYLPGLDILRHRLGGRSQGSGVEALLRNQRPLLAYLGWLDSRFGTLQDEFAGWHSVWIADPGRRAEAGAEGFVVVVSPEARRACVGPSIGDVDLAPLVLSLLGYPTSREMPGELPAGRCIGNEEFGERRVEGFGRRAVEAAGEVSDYDPEMVERLRSLGYLN